MEYKACPPVLDLANLSWRLIRLVNSLSGASSDIEKFTVCFATSFGLTLWLFGVGALAPPNFLSMPFGLG